ncbi:MAG TPA: fatty acid oxidation complex subunit alpha FadJ [Gemmatimonadaceae bacterium]|nr:fatty acid oxidation complex subunit alpha FadJ [Gemmatimonadaceae bacterium]
MSESTAPTRAGALSTERRGDVLIIWIDVPGEPVNTLGPSMVGEFEKVFVEVEQDRALKGVVIASAKASGFIAGADVEQFSTFRSPHDATQVSALGQELLNRLEKLPVPVVAAINGACLGGGLEVALACRYRVATNHPSTILALPEVQLGVIPGMGGTQRLPRLIGLQSALDMILAGRNIRAVKALKMGLVDEVVHPAILIDTAVDRARGLAEGRIRKSGRATGAVDLLLAGNPLGRSVVFRKARESVIEKTQGHYPAPLAALEAIRTGYDRGFKPGLNAEARLFGELAVSDVSRQLVFLFFARNATRKDPGVTGRAPEPRDIRKIGILGAGFMGAGIASVAVQQGTLVRLKDTEPRRAAAGLRAVRDVLKERLVRKQITRLQYDDMMVMVGATTDYSGFATADIVIEAVFEDLELKRKVLREAEGMLDPDAVYASNTSTIPIARIAEAAEHPERVLGMHFFSPVHKMPLLEVVVTPKTTPEATVTAVAYGKELGKTVIVVNDGPGFYTTRILSAYMNEAGRLLDEGAAIEAVDKALVDFGFPVGPITLLDEVGIDIGGHVGRVLAEAFGARMAPSDSLRRVVEAGRTGRKGRSGFYKYNEAGEKGDVDESIYAVIGRSHRADIPAAEIAERCVFAMVNEAVMCLEEGILRSPLDGDIGAVFGLGFPPFRGGPFRYIDSVGADTIVTRLEDLHSRFSNRFSPAQLLVEYARARKRFYPR